MELIPNAGLSLISLSRGVFGMFFLIFIAYLFSNNRKAIAWKTVGIGLIIQVFIAIGVLKINFVKGVFETIGGFFIKVLEYTGEGTKMLLGEFGNTETYGFIFVFQALPVIIFFSALSSILYYFGIIQKLVGFLAWGLTKIFKVSGAESLSVAGNIFLGQTEAPLLIKAYLEKMNRSEIFLVMVGGMSTVAGSVLGAYIGFLGGDDPIMQLEFAISIGTGEGIKMAVNVAAMLLVFIALIAMVSSIFTGIGDLIGINTWIASNTPYESFSIEFLMGYLFAPLMWIIGVATEDVALMGQLLGVKIVASEFVGYTQLVDLKNSMSPTHFSYQKSVIMATYMLCGFANFASIGIQIGGIGIIAPKIRKLLTELGFKAMVAGSIVSLMSATIAGIILG